MCAAATRVQKMYMGPTEVPALLRQEDDGSPKPALILVGGGGPKGHPQEELMQLLPLDDSGLLRVYVDLPRHGERGGGNVIPSLRGDPIRDAIAPVVVGMSQEVSHIIDCLRAHNLSGGRYGLFGWSLGGTAMLMAATSDRRISAAGAIAAPYDTSRMNMGRLEWKPEDLCVKRRCDLIAQASLFWPTAVLLVHGALDTWVKPDNSQLLFDALSPYYRHDPSRLRLAEYPHLKHDVLMPRDERGALDRKTVESDVRKWFETYLAAGPKPEGVARLCP